MGCSTDGKRAEYCTEKETEIKEGSKEEAQ